ncbi:hypothetical protein [Siminovitchia terrae]|uniref:hypothetical protein n=1 Tax=Siminovitchia terrae TaxID=1914933 RepID=UPI001BB3862D|nr:hypothetical protein [Siminovitchia terrae]
MFHLTSFSRSLPFHSLGVKPRLNKVKASGGCHRFSEEIYRAELVKIFIKYAKAHLIKISLCSTSVEG